MGWWREGAERGYIRRLHMLADLKSRHDLTAYLVREKSPIRRQIASQDFLTKQDCGDVFLALN